MPTLHVIIPFYNEHLTLRPCVQRVVDATLPIDWHKQLFLVDDHSDEEGRRQAEAIVHDLQQRGIAAEIEYHDRNCGKGAALRTGFDHVLRHAADNDAVIIQDADLEYDPFDFDVMIARLEEDALDAVIGNRFHKRYEADTVKRFLHRFGNRLLSAFSNLMTGLSLHDIESCYKVIRVSTLRRIRPMLTEDRFGIEPQIVAALARINAGIGEVPIAYEPRKVVEGKKIGWIDGLRAFYVMIRERFRRDQS